MTSFMGQASWAKMMSPRRRGPGGGKPTASAYCPTKK